MAAAVGATSFAKRILATPDVNINECANDRYTALHVATVFGNKETVAVLLEYGADVSIGQGIEAFGTPLHIAAIRNTRAKLSLLDPQKAFFAMLGPQSNENGPFFKSCRIGVA